jgi:hypothetical protein
MLWLPPAGGWPVLALVAGVVAASVAAAGSAVGAAVLPRLFGGGDRTWSRLVPWTVRSVLSERPVEPPRNSELSESYLYVRDAALACLGLAESLAGDPEAWAGRATPFPATATGADLFEVLTAPYLPSPLGGEGSGVRGQSSVPLLDAAAETVGWYRRFFHTPATTGAVVPARFAA